MVDQNSNSLLERYQSLLEISRNLASTLDLETLLNHIAQAASDLSNAQAASILLYDEIKQVLYFDAATNLEEPLMRGLIVPVENSLAGWIVTHRQPLIISDTQKDPRHYANIAKSTNVTTTSMLGVPLIAKEKVIGVLEAINKLEGEFNQEDQELLMALGAQAAVAIENARFFQQSDLISELVHEVRTPLTSLNTAARLLLRSNGSEEMRQNLVEMILAETNRLSEMTTAFLDLARLESGRMRFKVQVFDIQPLLDECASLMQAKAQEKNVEINVEVHSGVGQLKADEDMIKQVLLNLLSNAVKYNRPSGLITLTAASDQDEMILQVIDTGLGIPLESQPYIFEKFYRVPGTEKIAEGTGLGLSICKRIVDVHGGSIEMQSEPEIGTKFTIRLPLRAV
jgi:signal transduction histidine kinase